MILRLRTFQGATQYSSNFVTYILGRGHSCKGSLRFVRGMPPKKKGGADAGPGPLLGRFGTSLKCGIIGLPNVG